jgi:hypothetical protein
VGQSIHGISNIDLSATGPLIVGVLPEIIAFFMSGW